MPDPTTGLQLPGGTSAQPKGTSNTDPKRDFTKSSQVIEALKQSNPGIYRLMTDDSIINNMGRSLLTNPAYSGQTPEQMQRSLMFGEQLFAIGLMQSPVAQNLYMQSLQTLLKEQGTNGPLAKGQMNGPFGLPGLSGLDVMGSAYSNNGTRTFLQNPTGSKIEDLRKSFFNNQNNGLRFV